MRILILLDSTYRRVLSGQKNGSSTKYTAPTTTHKMSHDLTDNNASQSVDSGTGTTVYYDYIQPLNPIPKPQPPPPSNAHSTVTVDTVDVHNNYNITENYSYNRVPYGSSDLQETTMNDTASNPQSVPHPPLPPRDGLAQKVK